MIVTGDCLEALPGLSDGSVDAIVTDPPYSLSFMGRDWDSFDVPREDVALGYYLAGLIDGEGHFRVSAGDRRCEFAVRLRDDDRAILERAQRFIGHGRITAEPARDGSKPQARLIIDTKDGCEAVCRMLSRFRLRARKARDFDVWQKAVAEWLSMPRGNRWHGPADRSRLAVLGRRLRNGREYVEPPWSGNRYQDWNREWAAEALRVLKPGGHLLAFGGTRTYHRLACAIEDAGFEIRDTLCWLYGSGFPKSLDVGKAIDAAAGAEREVIGPSARHGGGIVGNGSSYELSPEPHTLTAPATPDAERWNGWGTALKPAHEPIVVARKPLSGTVAGNVLAHGTGALNVDGCRIVAADAPAAPQVSAGAGSRYVGAFNGGAVNDAEPRTTSASAEGRWPANVVLDPDAAAMLDAQTEGVLHGAGAARAAIREADPTGMFGMPGDDQRHGDTGGASRFFYVAKASSAERNAGLEGFEATGRTDDGYGSIQTPILKRATPRENWTPHAVRNVHPTVKPIELMRWLVRLVTPPGGLVIDPFAGSGTTGIAAILEGLRFIGVERDPEYAEIARARLEWWARQPRGIDLADALSAEAERERVRAGGQLELT